MEEKREIKKVLIAGIAGAGGSYLAEYLVENHPEIEVQGITRWQGTSHERNLKKIANKIRLYKCDLADLSATVRAIQNARPDAVFHVASYANVREAFENPIAVLKDNIEGTINLFESFRIADIKPFVLLLSTSELYGDVDPKDIPITESHPLNPTNPYSVSKLAQDALGFTYFKAYNLPVIRARMFSYINPRRKDLFATSFAYQVARIEAGLQKELLHGNLEATRTLIDVRDVAEACWLAILKCKAGEVYNIGRTEPITIGKFLEILKSKARREIPSRIDERLLRPTDTTLVVPDSSKFQRETGWKPRYSFEDSVTYLLDYCREEVARELKEQSS